MSGMNWDVAIIVIPYLGLIIIAMAIAIITCSNEETDNQKRSNRSKQ